MKKKLYLGFIISFLNFFGVNGYSKQVGEKASKKNGQPNIVYILLDDLDDVATKPFLSHVMPFTYGLFKSQGVVFENSFSGAICCVARASMLTGLYPHNEGVFTNSGKFGGYEAFLKPFHRDGSPIINPATGKHVSNEEITLANFLSQAGYRTALIGKYLNGINYQITGPLPDKPLGWTDGNVLIEAQSKLPIGYTGNNYHLMSWTSGNPNPRKEFHGAKERDYSTDVFKEYAVQFIKLSVSENPDQPFYLFLAPTAPHMPIFPAKRHKNLKKIWENNQPTNRPNFFNDDEILLGEESIWDKPEWLKKSWKQRTGSKVKKWVRRDWANRMASLYAADELVKKVFETLEKNKELDNTVIVFTSDNGYNLGAHGLIHKMAPYEETIRVPLIYVGGSKLGFKKNKIESQMALHIDHVPTLLELAKVKVDSSLDGVSLVSYLKQDTGIPTRYDFLGEYLGGTGINGIGAEMPASVREYFSFLGPITMYLDIPSYRLLRSRLPIQDKNKGQQWRDFAYIEWLPSKYSTGEAEIYDVTADPYQLHNLLKYNFEGCSNLKKLFASRLKSLKDCTGKQCGNSPDYVTNSALLNSVLTCTIPKRGK